MHTDLVFQREQGARVPRCACSLARRSSAELDAHCGCCGSGFSADEKQQLMEVWKKKKTRKAPFERYCVRMNAVGPHECGNKRRTIPFSGRVQETWRRYLFFFSFFFSGGHLLKNAAQTFSFFLFFFSVLKNTQMQAIQFVR